MSSSISLSSALFRSISITFSLGLFICRFSILHFFIVLHPVYSLVSLYFLYSCSLSFLIYILFLHTARKVRTVRPAGEKQPKARATIICDLRHYLLLLPRCIIYYFDTSFVKCQFYAGLRFQACVKIALYARSVKYLCSIQVKKMFVVLVSKSTIFLTLVLQSHIIVYYTTSM